MAKFLRAFVLMTFLAGCAKAPAGTGAQQALVVRVDYPVADTSIQMGRPVKAIVEVHDEAGAVVKDAQVTLSVGDASGAQVASVPVPVGKDGVYRSEGVPIPHRSVAGSWNVTAVASRPGAEGSASAAFQVKNSISEDLLQKYGFWVDEPSLGYMETSVGRERGDADNGDLQWSGFYVQMHVLKESHLEVYWRKGNFEMDSSAAVRKFLLDDVGNLGFLPLRELGEFKSVRFKQWDAWQGPVRGRLSQYDNQMMVFYAPEVDKTYALSTMVVLPPKGIDPHATLRGGFEVHPELNAHGQAPEPLPRLLPTPELVSPPLGTRYIGDVGPIVFTWKPLKELAKDEYYRVKIDYDYAETNTSWYYATRETQFTLPPELHAIPNCSVFNWQVTLMRQTGTDKDGQPIGEALSYDSLHWYVEWMYPSTDDAPFETHCQNPQT